MAKQLGRWRTSDPSPIGARPGAFAPTSPAIRTTTLSSSSAVHIHIHGRLPVGRVPIRDQAPTPSPPPAGRSRRGGDQPRPRRGRRAQRPRPARPELACDDLPTRRPREPRQHYRQLGDRRLHDLCPPLEETIMSPASALCSRCSTSTIDGADGADRLDPARPVDRDHL